MKSQIGRRRGRRRAGLTIIELLIVLLIIIVLAGILLPSIRKAKFAAVETAEMSALRQVMVACQNYALSYETWPLGSTLGDGNIEPLRKDLEKYILDPNEALYRDPWNDEPFIYANSKYYEVGTMRLSGPPITGFYNPTSFQLFSRGRDGEMSVQGFREENDDNMWADILNNRVGLFEETRAGKGL